MNREPAIPYYIQVAETIKSRIQQGEYSYEELIPPTHELEREFNVSNITVRKALEILVQEGLIERKRGIGTTVSRDEQKTFSFELSATAPIFLSSALKLKLDVKVLEITITPCPTRVRRILSMDSEKKVWRMKRMRRYKNAPIAFYIHYISVDRSKEITKELVGKMSFIDLLQKVCGVKLSKSEQRVEATTANMDLSSILDVNFGAPLFFVENIYYSKEKKPVAITQVYYRGDKTSFKAVLNFS
jgi:GntR family transcriptional regulator